jgi:hypothetical protein
MKSTPTNENGKRKKGNSEHKGRGGTGKETMTLLKDQLALTQYSYVSYFVVRSRCRARIGNNTHMVLSL